MKAADIAVLLKLSRTCLTQPHFHNNDDDLDLHVSAAFETGRGIKKANVRPNG